MAIKRFCDICGKAAVAQIIIKLDVPDTIISESSRDLCRPCVIQIEQFINEDMNE